MQSRKQPLSGGSFLSFCSSMSAPSLEKQTSTIPSISSIVHPISHGRRRQSRPVLVFNLSILVILYCALSSAGAPFSPKGYSEYVYHYESRVCTGSSTGFAFKGEARLEILHADQLDAKKKQTGSSATDWLISLSLHKPVFNELPGASSNNNLHISGKHRHLFDGDKKLYAVVEKRQHSIDKHQQLISASYHKVKQIYSHQADSTFYKNIKKSILANLLLVNNDNDTRNDIGGGFTFHDDNSLAQPELFSPHSSSTVFLRATKMQHEKSAKIKSPATTTTIQTNHDSNINDDSLQQTSQLTLFALLEGHQNVTFKSRVFSRASSTASTDFRLNLVDTLKGKNHELYDKADSIEGAIKTLHHNTKNQYAPDTIELQREVRQCTNHHCKLSPVQLYQHYRGSLAAKSMAEIEGSVAFLRILDRLRLSKDAKPADLLDILKKLKNDHGARAAFLDILAAARTRDTIAVALKFLKLPTNDDLDTAERFLTVLSVAAKTFSKMHLPRPLKLPYNTSEKYNGPGLKLDRRAREQQSKSATLKSITEDLLSILIKTPAAKWRSNKLRWSTWLTVASIINAHHQEHNYTNVEDDLTKRVSSLLLNELESCHERDLATECRIVFLQSIGNVGQLNDLHFNAIEQNVLNGGRRESIVGMKVLRDLLAHRHKNEPYNDDFNKRLKGLLLRVAYDNTKETTSRVLASELIVRFLPGAEAIAAELISHLPSFANRELATMIHSRMVSFLDRANNCIVSNGKTPATTTIGNRYADNWFWKCCIINGTSASFVRQMASTDSLNASYGVNVELLNGQKILKESSFDVFLDTKDRTQDLFSLGIFARGLTNIPLIGGSKSTSSSATRSDNRRSSHELKTNFNLHGNDSAEDGHEGLISGMNLKLLGGYLRPYIFFSSYFELGKHLFWGTAKNMMTAFSGNLLLIDHDEAYPLISGFVVEQQMRGVLSIEVSGKAEASLMSGSHSVVRTKASIIVQASQSIFTSYENLWLADLFSFGGETLIDFVADASWSSKPYEMCLQVSQPEFLIRFNSRRRDQILTETPRRKLTKQNYHMAAKSYSLNKENNRMCSRMLNDNRLVEYDLADTI